MKQRATLSAGIAILALLPASSGATVLEFDESGAVSKKLSVNYIQRARYERHRANEQAPIVTVPVVSNGSAETARNVSSRIEHIVNDISIENAAVAQPVQSTAWDHANRVSPDALELVARLPPQAITYIDAGNARLPIRKSLARAPSWTAKARLVAQNHNLPPEVFIALIDAESGFNPNAVSPKGAIGLAQLMPETAAALGVDPNDPQENLVGGARYLAQQFERFGTWPLALAAYNAGPTRVAKLGRIPNFPETKAFVARVMTASGFVSAPITTASN